MERKWIALVDVCDRDMKMDICHMTGHGKRPLHVTGQGKRPVIYSVYVHKYQVYIGLTRPYRSIFRIQAYMILYTRFTVEYKRI
jgi:hypothetical protein